MRLSSLSPHQNWRRSPAAEFLYLLSLLVGYFKERCFCSATAATRDTPNQHSYALRFALAQCFHHLITSSIGVRGKSRALNQDHSILIPMSCILY